MTTYTVEFTIIVDHPEKRCETLPKVFAGAFIIVVVPKSRLSFSNC